MTTATIATFHPFPRLPFELRTCIWELTVEPRIVEVRVVHHDPSPVKVTDPDSWSVGWMKKRLPPVRLLRSPTPAPAQLQTCREAREHLSRHPYNGYQKAFSEIMTEPHGGFDPVDEDDPQGERDRYVWLNFDIDIVSIGQTDLHDFRAVAYQVRRLRLQRSLGSEYFCRTESNLIARLFTHLTEIYVVFFEGMRVGYKVADDIDFRCGPENVYFVDPQAMDKMMSSVDLDAMMDRECEEFDRLAELEEQG